MEKIIFYSWQSDLPNSTNRGLIEAVLKKAATAIATDSSIEVEPVIERDTEGVAGSPDISKTILEKIDRATIFVGDVSIINKNSSNRPTPNPNVLIELGYAVKTLSWDKICLVMNKEFGGPELLPFDLKMRRTLVYSAAEGEADRTTVKKALGQGLEQQIRSILGSLVPEASLKKPHENLIATIEAQTPARIREARGYMDFLCKNFEQNYPGKYTGNEYDESVASALELTLEHVIDFAHVVESVAIYNDEQVLKELFLGFKKILEHYHLPIGYSGQFSEADFDFYKFIGDELFTTIVSILLREQKWGLLKSLLGYRVIVSNAGDHQAETVGFEFIGYFDMPAFRTRDQRLKRLSARADLLKQRHDLPALTLLSPFTDYIAADFFLFLKSKRSGSDGLPWHAWSSVYLEDLPHFLIAAQSRQGAEQLVEIFNFKDIEELKTIVVRCASELGRFWSRGSWRNPITERAMENIGKYA